MKTRIISGLMMVPLLILVFLGGPFIKAACFLIAVVGIKEFFNGFKAIDIKPSYTIALISVILLYAIDLLVMLNIAQQYTLTIYMGWIFLTILMSLLYLFKIDERKLEDAMATITGIIYIGFFSYHAVLTEDSFSQYCNFSPVWLILITAFFTDIFAYFSGYFFGKHKLCPVISPKKTIEGSIGGIIGSVVFTVLFGYFFMGSVQLIWFVVIGIAGGIISQFGDLTASIFKRKMGIKDYGKLIPGHGGIMDRFDSVLFTAPMVYYMLTIIFAISG